MIILRKKINERGADDRLTARAKRVAAVAVLCAMGALLAACEEEAPTPDPVQTHPYECENGTKDAGNAPSAGVTKCTACESGYRLDDEACVALVPYECENGTKDTGNAPSAGITKCTACEGGYRLDANTLACVVNAYVCENGTATAGNAPSTDVTTNCAMCDGGYRLEGGACVVNAYVCENGTATAGNAPSTVATTNCVMCDGGYQLNATTKACVANTYVCSNGDAVTAITPTGVNGENRCASCGAGFDLNSNFACAAPTDRDGDGILNGADVDDDNDGLIEIATLTELHNIRYNLAGTTYDDEAADTTGNEGDTTGAPTAATSNCKTAGAGTGADATYLCGYELVANLDFDTDDADTTTYTEGGGAYTLDSDDADSTYFPVNSGAGGWLPIGDSTTPFTALFEGNGNTIANLAVRRDQNTIGLFGQIGTGALIRNVGVTGFLADHTGSTTTFAGGLAGVQSGGTIIASYASGTADGGSGNDRVGGLAGGQSGGTIIASYATGSVDGSGGVNDFVGGLVGRQTGGTIIASYATGSVDGGAGNVDSVGGLVGLHEDTAADATIIASYATGAVNGGGGTGDHVGGLVGLLQGTSPIPTYTIASYATGTATGGDGTGDYAGSVIGRRVRGTNLANYGFGDADGEEDGVSTQPQGFGSDKDEDDLTEANTQVCSTPTHTTKAACETASGTWVSWNDAANDTLNAWDFGSATQAPRLRYADYDGAGTDYNCAMFPATLPDGSVLTCGTTLLPGQ